MPIVFRCPFVPAMGHKQWGPRGLAVEVSESRHFDLQVALGASDAKPWPHARG